MRTLPLALSLVLACSSVETSAPPEDVGEARDVWGKILPADVDAGLCHELCCYPSGDVDGWGSCGTAPIPGIVCPAPGVCFDLDAGADAGP